MNIKKEHIKQLKQYGASAMDCITGGGALYGAYGLSTAGVVNFAGMAFAGATLTPVLGAVGIYYLAKSYDNFKKQGDIKNE